MVRIIHDLHISRLAWSSPIARLWFHIIDDLLDANTRLSLCDVIDSEVSISRCVSATSSLRVNIRISGSAGGYPSSSSRRINLIIGHLSPNLSASLDLPIPLLWTNTKVLA